MRGHLFSRARRWIGGPSDLWLLGRTMIWAFCLSVLKHLLPLPTLVRLVRSRASGRERQPGRDEQLVTFARWSCRLTTSRGGNCLARGLVLYRYLGAFGAQPELRVGFSRGDAGRVLGHAWVVVDGQPVGEDVTSLAPFDITVAFGPSGYVRGPLDARGYGAEPVQRAPAAERFSRSTVRKSGRALNHPA